MTSGRKPQHVAGPLQLNKPAGNRLELGQKWLHTRAERAPRPEGGDSSDSSKQGLSGSANNTSSLSFSTELEGSLSHSWNLLPQIASLPPQTPGSSWAATRPLEVGETLCAGVKGGNRIKITTGSSKILL